MLTITLDIQLTGSKTHLGMTDKEIEDRLQSVLGNPEDMEDCVQNACFAFRDRLVELANMPWSAVNWDSAPGEVQ